MNTQKLKLPRKHPSPNKRLNYVLPSIKETKDELYSNCSNMANSVSSGSYCSLSTKGRVSFSILSAERLKRRVPDTSPAVKGLSQSAVVIPKESLKKRASNAKKICISPNYNIDWKNKHNLNTRKQQFQQDIMLARETRLDHMKAEMARMEARKKRHSKRSPDYFSFLLSYFGCC